MTQTDRQTDRQTHDIRASRAPFRDKNNLILSLIFLLLEIKIVGVIAMARPGPMRLNTSRIVVRRLRRNTIMLKRQSAMKPVVRETNSAL